MSDGIDFERIRTNKLRTTGGSFRLTLVKGAVDKAGIDPRPPRPTLAHLPAAPGAWLAFDVDRYPSQRDRVAVRAAVTERLAPETTIVGEFPVELRGKLGSAVTRVPGELLEAVDIAAGDELANTAIGTGCILVLCKSSVTVDPEIISDAIEAARERLPHPADS